MGFLGGIGDFLFGEDPKTAKLNLIPSRFSTGWGEGIFDPNTGQLSSSLSPYYQYLRDSYYKAAQGLAPTPESIAYADSLFGKGQDIIKDAYNLNLDQMAQKQFDAESAVLAPSRAQEESRLKDTLFGSGRLGLGVGRGSTFVNPDQFTLLAAREEADARRALTAQDRARSLQSDQIRQGLGLFDVSNTLKMRPWENAGALMSAGMNIEDKGAGLAAAAAGLAPTQANIQNAKRAQQQAIYDAEASPGLFGGDPLQTLLNAGIGYATGGWTGALAGAIGGGNSNLAGVSGLFNMGSNLWNGLSGWGTSPSSSWFGNSGFGNMVDSFNSSYVPINTGISPWGAAPSNWGGGTLGPNMNRINL